jgi:hypothetical protein
MVPNSFRARFSTSRPMQGCYNLRTPYIVATGLQQYLLKAENSYSKSSLLRALGLPSALASVFDLTQAKL